MLFRYNYYEYEYNYGSPSLVPQTGISQASARTLSIQAQRASAFGQTLNQATGPRAATRGSTIAASVSGLSSKLTVSDTLGRGTFVVPPLVQARIAGANAAGVTVGRNYYATEPAFSLTGTQGQSNINAGYAAGAQGNVFNYVQGSKSSAARSEVVAVTGQQQLDFDVGRRRRRRGLL